MHKRPLNVALAALALSLTACTASTEADRVLKAAGYSDIELTGYRVFGCAESDEFHTGFIARGPHGHRVTGVVCSGVLKGATIRID